MADFEITDQALHDIGLFIYTEPVYMSLSLVVESRETFFGRFRQSRYSRHRLQTIEQMYGESDSPKVSIGLVEKEDDKFAGYFGIKDRDSCIEHLVHGMRESLLHLDVVTSSIGYAEFHGEGRSDASAIALLATYKYAYWKSLYQHKPEIFDSNEQLVFVKQDEVPFAARNPDSFVAAHSYVYGS